MITDLETKVAKENYGKYLKRLTLRKLRGFTDREVTFDFPVTALVGPNCGGKTTVPRAAALAYKSVSPGRFFAKSGKYDSSMQNWSIEYEIIDKEHTPRLSVSRTAKVENLQACVFSDHGDFRDDHGEDALARVALERRRRRKFGHRGVTA